MQSSELGAQSVGTGLGSVAVSQLISGDLVTAMQRGQVSAQVCLCNQICLFDPEWGSILDDLWSVNCDFRQRDE